MALTLKNVTTCIGIVSLKQLSLRTIVTSSICQHSPGIKKKTKVLMDPKKLQRQKERQEMKQRKQVITPPVDPDSIPDPSWFNADKQRHNFELTETDIEERTLLQKEWSRFQMKTHVSDLKILRDKVKCRVDAMRELKKESAFLYEEALKVDKEMFPLTMKGPMETPPLEGYEAPDFVDNTK